MATFSPGKKNPPGRHREALMRLVIATLLPIALFSGSPSPLRAQINTDNVTLMGRNAIAMNDFVTAIQFFNQVIEVKPHLYAPFYYRAYAKFSLDDYIGAEADCSRALQLNPYMSEIYQLRGLCRIHNEDFQGAIDDYTLSLREEPDDQGAIYNRALCRMELNDFETADKDIDFLLSKWHKFQRAYLLKAQIAMEMKDTARSMVWVDSLLRIYPRNEQAWSFKGRYALSKSDYALADSCLSEAIRLNPNNYEHYVARAQARHGLNHFDLALRDYDHTIQLIPQHFIAHYNRGLLRALVGDKNRAIEDFDFILSEEPDNTLAIYNRALLREETGDYRGAVSDYSQLIKSYPNFTYGYLSRAGCLRKLGDVNGAIRDESVVARAQLDMKYRPHQRRPMKKVRLRSDHSLDQYQQLVEEAPDTARRFVNQLIGKIQNRKVEQAPMPAFTLAFRTPAKSTDFRTAAYLPELDRLNRQRWVSVALSLEANTDRTRSLGELRQLSQSLQQQGGQAAMLHLLRSVVNSGMYNYQEALRDISLAIRQDSSQYLCYLQRAGIHIALQQSSAASIGKSGENVTAKPQIQHYALALADLEKALRLSPENAYLLYNRACLHTLMHQTAAALADYNTALETDPRLAEARYNRAILYLQQGETDKAIPDLSRAGQEGLYKAYNLLKQAAQMKNEEKKAQQRDAGEE